MFGRSAEELTSAPVAQFTHPDDVAATAEYFRTAGDPDTPRQIEKRYLHKSGRAVWARVSYSVVHDANGEPSHVVSQIEDISKRRESDRALLEAFETDRAATERLRRLDRIRAEMASTVSHELRTPLTSAAGYVELLAEGDAGPLTAEQRQMLDIVARSLSRLDGIVDDVLDIAAPDSPEPRPLRRARLSTVLHSAVAAVAIQAATRGQDLIIQDELDSAEVLGDPGRLERAVVNLLTNALKFTPEDGKIIVRGTADRGRGDDQCDGHRHGHLRRGPGPHLRAPLPRRPDAAPGASGSGLGLAIVQTITTQYGGRVSVDSALGAGATFTLTLPLAE